MNAMFLMQTQQIYNSITTNKSKEKTNMVLEPLQAMIQLSLLSVLPIGSKLTIDNNILYIQTPTLTQPIKRWYNSDKKDDLFFLFQVIRRFLKWYTPDIIPKNFYNLLISMATNGLDNLIKTYQNTENPIIVQVINMYKNMLINAETSEIAKMEIQEDDKINIDEIFHKITEIYSYELINIIYNTLIIIQKETELININNFIEGLNLIMNSNNRLIHTWILNKLVI